MYLGRTILIPVGHSCWRLDSTNPQRSMSLAPCIKHLVSRPIHKVHWRYFINWSRNYSLTELPCLIPMNSPLLFNVECSHLSVDFRSYLRELEYVSEPYILISVTHSYWRLDDTNFWRPINVTCSLHEEVVSRPIHNVQLNLLYQLAWKVLLFNAAALPGIHELPFLCIVWRFCDAINPFCLRLCVSF